MARKKKGRRRQQGLVSWAGSVLSLAIGLSGVAAAYKQGGLANVANQASFGTFRGGNFDLKSGAPLYVPMVAGLVFKKIFSALTKAARIQSLIPRIG